MPSVEPTDPAIATLGLPTSTGDDVLHVPAASTILFYDAVPTLGPSTGEWN